MPLSQFDIASHYDVMEQLDRDVHDNVDLSRSEANLVMKFLGGAPKRMFLPCFGTGRHIQHFLDAGVQRIVGVDLSSKCIAKANESLGNNPAVSLIEADLTTWRTEEQFDAVVLLGNSFADCVDPGQLPRITQGMVHPLVRGGQFIMDYVGENYLARCTEGKSNSWRVEFNDLPALDHRISEYDSRTKVMTIRIRVTPRGGRGGKVSNLDLWKGYYQKLILSPDEVESHFAEAGIDINPMGLAMGLHDYAREHAEQLGMIGQSNWWLGTKN